MRALQAQRSRGLRIVDLRYNEAAGILTEIQLPIDTKFCI